MSILEQNIRQTLELLLPKIQKRHEEFPDSPIILGITGLQGSGKSTWASTLVRILSEEHNLHSITVSLDDFYKTHADLQARRDKDPENKLYRVRGQPGTHDEHLAADFFRQLRTQTPSPQQQGQPPPLKIPSFDKSRFNGEGDRAPESSWPIVHQKPSVVVFEGWCVGFQPLPREVIEAKHQQAVQGQLTAINTPAQHQIQHLLEVNDSLARYCTEFMGPWQFDFFIHIDTEDLANVYMWRQEQEHKLIEEKGQGMTDEEVRRFIDGYMPSYEIYLDGLRKGLFRDGGRMVRVVLDKERRVVRREVL